MTDHRTIDNWECSREVAVEAVSAFSELHPKIKMNYAQWADLKECIEREVMVNIDADFSGDGARDLLKDPLYNDKLKQSLTQPRK